MNSCMFRQVTKSVAEALGMEVSDVVALKNEGKTLAQIIADNIGDFDAIVDTLVEQLRERLQEKVDSGDITQEKMDHRLDRAEERINAVLNGEDFAAHDGEGAARFDHLAARDQRLAGCRRNIIDLDIVYYSSMYIYYT